jgi:hypothetical protein
LVPTVTTSWKSTRGEGGEAGAGRRVGGRRRRKRRNKRGVAPLLKCRDPHLAGGEKQDLTWRGIYVSTFMRKGQMILIRICCISLLASYWFSFYFLHTSYSMGRPHIFMESP